MLLHPERKEGNANRCLRHCRDLWVPASRIHSGVAAGVSGPQTSGKGSLLESPGILGVMKDSRGFLAVVLGSVRAG